MDRVKRRGDVSFIRPRSQSLSLKSQGLPRISPRLVAVKRSRFELEICVLRVIVLRFDGFNQMASSPDRPIASFPTRPIARCDWVKAADPLMTAYHDRE